MSLALRSCILLSIAFAGALFVWRAPASAQDAAGDPTERAKTLFKQGVADYEAGSYEKALESFQEAYRLKPHPLVRVNMANCYDKLGKPLQAMFHFERFLEEGEGNPEQRREVRTALERLRAATAELRLRVTPDGATVVVDGGDKRTAPILDPLRLEAGMHVVEVTLEGYAPAKRDVVLSGGQRLEVEITLERPLPPVVAISPTMPPTPAGPAKTAAPAPAATPEAKKPAPERAPAPKPAQEPESDDGKAFLPVSAWITGSLTVALFVATVVTGQLALSAEADFDDARTTVRDYGGSTAIERQGAYADALDAADRADALALTTDILLIAGALGAATTTYLAIDHHSDDDPPASASAAQPALTGSVGPLGTRGHGAAARIRLRF